MIRLISSALAAVLFLSGLGAMSQGTVRAATDATSRAQAAPCTTQERYFDVTSFCVPNIFAEYWDTHGGLSRQGWPISPAFSEVNPTNGQTYLTQYFERARFEWHPENAPPYNVLLGLVGREQFLAKYPNGAPTRPGGCLPDEVYFDVTAHCVSARFYAAWRANGELAQQGYPISDQFEEVSPTNGLPYQVQYFERARFEYHPENEATAPDYVVLFGLLGREQYFARYPNGVAPPPPIVFQDGFTDPSSGWPTIIEATGRYTAGYNTTEYRVTISVPSLTLFVANAKLGDQTNSQAEVDIQQTGGPTTAIAGLTCRYRDASNFYTALIDPGGFATISKVVAGQGMTLADTNNNPHPAIRKGNEVNHLRFDCVGNTFTLFVNGAQVLKAQDGALPSGRTTLIAGTLEQPGVDVRFRTFVLRQP